MNSLSRKDAVAAGLVRYFTGKPCVRGHLSERYVSTMQCVECVAAHAQAWQRENRTNIRAAQSAWRKRNPEQVKAWKSASQKRNRASANARQGRYVEANRDTVYARAAEWAKANPGKVNAKAMRYHADKLQRTPPWADHFVIDGMYELAAIFRGVGLNVEVDHEVPLRGRHVSGLHVHDNLRLIHSSVNKAKANHF